MKSAIALTAASFIMGAGIVSAAAQTVVIAPEQETIIREYVTTQPAVEVDPGVDFEIKVGSIVPETIEVKPIEAPELDDEFAYVVVEDRTVVVEPETRKIVHIIE